MLHRALAALIVLFWLTMTALLVHRELYPEKSTLRSVGLEHVLKLVFLHQQPSLLGIHYDGSTVGHLRLHPTSTDEERRRLLEFSGMLHVRMADAPGQRLTWNGLIEMSRGFEVERTNLALTVREPAVYRAELQMDHVAKQARFSLEAGGRILRERVYPLDADGARQVLEELGLDPAILRALEANGDALAPTITAEQSSMLLEGEKVETYRVTVQQSGQTLLQLQVSQIGELLHVKTLPGYTLEPEG